VSLSIERAIGLRRGVWAALQHCIAFSRVITIVHQLHVAVMQSRTPAAPKLSVCQWLAVDRATYRPRASASLVSHYVGKALMRNILVFGGWPQPGVR
jgi:hypothetical protein